MEICHESLVLGRTHCQNLLLGTVHVVEWICLAVLSKVQSSAASSSTDICMNPTLNGLLLMMQEDCDTEETKS